MSTGHTTTWARDLAERCAAAGFNVVTTRSGYRIEGDEGQTVGFHKTQSDGNSRRVVMRDLNKMGLSAREAELAARAENERKATLAADAKRNTTKTATVVKQARQSAMVAKAAGEYAVHTDESWPLRKHPAPACRLMEVTPALAEKMLAFNTKNRPIKRGHKTNLMTDMITDRWVLTHQGIAFDTDGVLIDGQHRLESMVDTNTTLLLFVFVGIDVRAFAFIDVHSRRSGKDTIMAGRVIKNAALTAATVRFVYIYEHEHRAAGWRRYRVDNEQVATLYGKHGDMFDWAVREASNARNQKKGYSATVIAALLFIVRHKGASLHEIDRFLHAYKTGEDIGGGHPILALRRQAERYSEMDGHSINSKLQFGQMVMAWNAFVEGRNLHTVTGHRLDDEVAPITVRAK